DPHPGRHPVGVRYPDVRACRRRPDVSDAFGSRARTLHRLYRFRSAGGAESRKARKAEAQPETPSHARHRLKLQLERTRRALDTIGGITDVARTFAIGRK